MIRPFLQSLRPAQWAKNVFVLAPLVFGGMLLKPEVDLLALLALIAFCCASSAVYLINDIRDREEDRRHPLKRLRPLAAGTLKVPATGDYTLGIELWARWWPKLLRLISCSCRGDDTKPDGRRRGARLAA